MLLDFSVIAKHYNISRKEYYYTVSSMLPHKNLVTLLKLMQLIKTKKKEFLPSKIVISGVGGKSESEIKKMINELSINENVIRYKYHHSS